MNDMGNPLDHGFNQPEQPWKNFPTREMEAGPSGTRRDEDDANAHLSFDATQVATVHEDEGVVRVVSRIVCIQPARSMVLHRLARFCGVLRPRRRRLISSDEASSKGSHSMTFRTISA